MKSALYLAIATLLSSPALAQTQNIVSYTVYADGPCNGTEMIPAYIGNQTAWFSQPGGNIIGPLGVSGTPFPTSNLWIIGYGLAVQYSGLDPALYDSSFAMSGIANGIGGDYLAPKMFGPGTEKEMFPRGLAMALNYGDIGSRHVDMHVYCPQGYWYATLTLYTTPQ